MTLQVMQVSAGNFVFGSFLPAWKNKMNLKKDIFQLSESGPISLNLNIKAVFQQFRPAAPWAEGPAFLL